MASLGIFEIAFDSPEGVCAYQRPNKKWLTPFDGLKAFRLTELGAYALGIRDSISLEIESTKKSELYLMEHSPILVAKYLSPADELFLKRYMDKIAPGRWRLSVDKVAHIVQNHEDIKQLKSDIKRLVGRKKLPDCWNKCFAKVERRLNPLKPSFMLVFSLDDDQELLEIIMNDPSLSKMIFRMEGRRVAVPFVDAKKFAKRLTHYGYRIDIEEYDDL